MFRLSPWQLVALAVLATFRLVWLINTDVIAAPIRRAAERHDRRKHGPPEPDEIQPLSYLVECPWCVSIYVAPVVATVAVLWGDNRVVLIALVALACSALTGIIATCLHRLIDSGQR